MKLNDTTLKQELAKHMGKTVYIGAKSSFVFIGPAGEALSSLPLLALMMQKGSIKHRVKTMQDDGMKLGNRKVKKVYDHDKDGSKTIIIEGREFGMFWTRQECLVQKRALEDAIAPMLGFG